MFYDDANVGLTMRSSKEEHKIKIEKERNKKTRWLAGSTVNSLYNEVADPADQAFVIRKFVNAITNYSLYIPNNSL